MRLLRRRTLIITLFAFGALPLGAAQAAAPRPWATVNVCDTTSAPNTIGIRAWIPGARSAKRPRSLRFVVQYYSETEKRWLPVAEGGDSGYLSVGTGTKARQFGRSFRIDPMPGESVLLRGKVTVRSPGRDGVARYARVLTHGGHRETEFADPAGYSDATCRISST